MRVNSCLIMAARKADEADKCEAKTTQMC